MNKKERTDCRLPDKSERLFWKFKRFIASMNILKIFYFK